VKQKSGKKVGVSALRPKHSGENDKDSPYGLMQKKYHHKKLEPSHIVDHKNFFKNICGEDQNVYKKLARPCLNRKANLEPKPFHDNRSKDKSLDNDIAKVIKGTIDESNILNFANTGHQKNPKPQPITAKDYQKRSKEHVTQVKKVKALVHKNGTSEYKLTKSQMKKVITNCDKVTKKLKHMDWEKFCNS